MLRAGLTTHPSWTDSSPPWGLRQGFFAVLNQESTQDFLNKEHSRGGVISPLLANIALNGIESVHRYKDIHQHYYELSVCYADDMIIILRPQDDAEQILERISQFLAERGLKVSEKKTRLTATTDGFDFLGWQRQKCRATVSLDASLQWTISKLFVRK